MTQNRFLRFALKGAGVAFAMAIASFAAQPFLRSANSAGPPASERVAGAPQTRKVIARMWHGRTLTSRADEYYVYLKEAGIDKIRAIEGNLGAQVFRRTNGKATEFTVISYWESRDAIKRFAGNDIEKTHFLAKDRQYLLELEPKVKHFEVLFDERK